jgi:sugar phosphate isomerase/epimerase
MSRIGIYARSLPGDDPLEAARERGLDGVIFNSVVDLSPTVDPGELRDVKARADALGLDLAVGVGRIHPHSVPLGRDELARMVAAAVDALGCRELWFSIAGLADRFSTSVPWPEQLGATERFLADFAPVLRDHGARLNLKTHEEITSREIADLIEAVGPDVLGCSLDPVNLLVRLEDPLTATRRLAPYVRHVHVDDALVYFVNEGIARKLYPVGEGVIDWPEILQAVRANEPAFWIELHKGQFTMPIFDPAWLEPGLDRDGLAAVVRLATIGDRRLRTGTIPPPDVHEADPLRRLGPTLALLREALA